MLRRSALVAAPHGRAGVRTICDAGLSDNPGNSGHESVDGGVAVGPDGSTYLTGIHSLVGPPLKIFLVKFAPDGSIAWQQTWDGPDPFFDSRSSDAAISPDGSAVYVTGTSFISPNLPVLLKFNAAHGSLAWAKSWGGNAFPEGVAVDIDGSIYVSGSVNTSDSQQVFVTRFASDGSLVWDRGWGATSGGDVALFESAHLQGEESRQDAISPRKWVRRSRRERNANPTPST